MNLRRLILTLLLSALAGCAVDRAHRPKPGRLIPLTSSTLSSFQDTFNRGRDELRYVVVFSPT